MINHLFLKTILFLWILCISFDANGFSYEYLSDGQFVSIHILTVDPKEHMILPVRASGDDVKRETVSILAKRYGATAAINGGFWKSNGNSTGILKIDHHWYGTPIKPRGAIGWSLNGQKVIIDRVLTNFQLHNCPDDKAIEVMPARNLSHTSAEEWEVLEHIVGGTPILICKGNLIDDYSCEQTLESFLINRHPRTAVGLKDDGKWVFVVVDGRFLGCFGGMTMKQLAELMLDLGCIEALNLDGGGSSTLVIDNTVVNEPCGDILEDGKNVRAVSDAILIF